MQNTGSNPLDRTKDQAASNAPASSADNIEALLNRAEEDLAELERIHDSAESSDVKAFEFSPLSEESSRQTNQPMDMLGDVELDLRIELGRTQMTLQEVLRLRGGSVVTLDCLAGDPVNVFANDRLVARGEIVVMDNNFCVRVTELVGS